MPYSEESERRANRSWRPISRLEIDRLVRSLATAYEVIGVQERQGRLTRDRVEDPSTLRLEFPPPAEE